MRTIGWLFCSGEYRKENNRMNVKLCFQYCSPVFEVVRKATKREERDLRVRYLK